MNVTTSIATDDAIRHVVDNLWQRGRQEMDILGVSREKAVEMIVESRSMGAPTMAWCADGAPVFVAGLIPTGPSVMCTWFLATPEFTQHQRRITMALWREMTAAAKEHDLKEIEVFSACVHPSAARWFEALGMKLDIDRHSVSAGQVRTYRFVRRFKGV